MVCTCRLLKPYINCLTLYYSYLFRSSCETILCNYSTLYAATLDSVEGSVDIGAIAGGVTGALIGVILTIIIIVMVIIFTVLTYRKKESSGKLFCVISL